MKASRIWTRAIPLAFACSIASAAAVWTPIACGCVDAWETVAWGIGRKDIKRADQITARAIADGLAKKYQGKVVRPRDLPFATSTYDCASASTPSHAIRCRWWLWESGSDKKGYDIEIRTDRAGVFQRILVVPVVYVDPTSVGGT